MKKKRALQIFAIFCVLAAALLVLYFTGAFKREEQISPIAQREVEKNGILAEFYVEPEAGILPGDILRLQLEILFDPSRVEIDAKKSAEEYVQFKNNSLRDCEEYKTAELNDETMANLSRIKLHASFQCWLIGPQQISLTIPVQYTQKEDEKRNASTLHLSKRLSFIALPTANDPRPLAEHRVSRNIPGILLIALGSVIIFSTALWLAISKRLRQKAKGLPGESSAPDYYIDLMSKITEAIAQPDLTVAYDKMYHLCLDLETKNENLNTVIKPLKDRLRPMYEHKAISHEEAESILDELRQIIKAGGEAK